MFFDHNVGTHGGGVPPPPPSPPMMGGTPPPTVLHGGHQRQGSYPPQGSSNPWGPSSAGADGSNAGGGGAGGFHDSIMIRMAMQQGIKAIEEGQSTVWRVIPVADARKRFRVTNEYVRSKLGWLLFPFTRNFSRRTFSISEDGRDDQYCDPADDVAAPDLYIPCVALLSFICLATFAKGFRQHDVPPEWIAEATSWSLFLVASQVLVAKLVFYLLSIPAPHVLDLTAVFGYIFFAASFVACGSLFGLPRVAYWAVTIAFGASYAFFVFGTLSELVHRGKTAHRFSIPVLALSAAQVLLLLLIAARL